MKAALLAAACAVALVGCGSTRGPDDWRSNHVDAKIGSVRLVHLTIEAPPMDQQQVGGNLPLYVTIFNDGDVEQVLDSVSTTEVQQVVYRDASGAVVQPLRVVVPARGQVSMQKGGGRSFLELQGVNRQLGATPIPVTFRFPRAGSVTVRVPVVPVSTPSPS
ncbi:copper chaperone PCu(A)C [Nonomuraea soli]|uniref:Copper(I)-binding protein n=1 Tax=Nonomuraea soli TaxID=1032476 RepID=A0A7W0CG36_9ACTN|nr:copper chaperone PCu(A)C [Nonomuraea soli]MBA2890461.1 copper(I)-binding protein [Nonomuraea soli]